MEKSSPLTVLVIGPSQNGKSTLINRLINLSITRVDLAEEGDGNFKCNQECKIYTLEVPLTDYLLIDLNTGAEHEVPDPHDEERVFKESWWKKQNRSKYAIRQRQPHGPRIYLRLIDTPGLDDSEGKDFENLSNVLATLNDLSKSPLEWERSVHAIVLVYNANNCFSYSFQNVIKDYERCMPNLFGGLSVVNTNFSMTVLAQKRQHLLRDKVLGTGESARSRIIRDRRADFAKILGIGRYPTHFFIDSRPKATLAYDELVSCNTISNILNFWAGSNPMPISHMTLVKNENMLAIDKKLQTYLFAALHEWEAEKRELLLEVSKHDALCSMLEQLEQELTHDEERIKSILDPLDNESEYTIQKYTTYDDPSVLRLFGGWIFRKKITGTYYIKESEYDEYDVEPQDGFNDRWTSYSFDHSSMSWTGDYEAKPGKVPSLVARSYTTNRVKHRDRISELKADLRRTRDNLAEINTSIDTNCSKDTKGKNPKLDRLVEQIAEAKDLSELLGKGKPSLDKAFDEVARVRYRKDITKVNPQDLFDMVRRVKPMLEKPLRSVPL